jgi:hypothetical protein
MEKFIRIFEFAQHLFVEEHTARQASEIMEGIREARSPRLSDIAVRMAGNEGTSYKRIQRFLRDNDPREALKTLF